MVEDPRDANPVNTQQIKMLFFCEDCGEKNFLVPKQFKDGKALFKCGSCDFFNSYVFQVSGKRK